MPKRLAFLGPPGTFSEEAALLYDASADLVPVPSIPAVATAVLTGMAEEGIVPIENSLEGSVNETLDLLIQEPHLRIWREVVLAISHCLLVKPGTRHTDIQVIYSHPQALGQCRRYLESLFPKVKREPALSTVAAVEQALQSSVPAGAIAPARAAALYPVEVLAQGIQDNPNNFTRFVVLAHHDHPPTGDDKTSLAFTYDTDRPGLLHEALGFFATRGINLAKIESRPTKQVLGRYIFLLDLEGHRESPQVKAALDDLGRQAAWVRVFGSYPRWRGPTQARQGSPAGPASP
ncbi:MAG: prephenate dehydratase [Dehalococcoidia bacterium]|nr:prephenate dehydratase [Dehalococcoidia bacterium]MDW8120502.1 prephenate dehydratase [Chloroflexota bacterium]